MVLYDTFFMYNLDDVIHTWLKNKEPTMKPINKTTTEDLAELWGFFLSFTYMHHMFFFLFEE